MSHARYLVGDVFDRMVQLEDGTVDLILTSPPFLALRSYLPADHPDKAKEIGSEATPAAFLDTLLTLTAEWRRLLAPHGSICVELGDSYSGSGGAGGDYNADGLREGQPKFHAGTPRWDGRPDGQVRTTTSDPVTYPARGPSGWPLAKSLCAIPQLYEASLAYGRNLLTGEPSPAGQWRVRNMVAWCRPNPPVGALGDKFRPATSYLTIACVSDRRYFDLDAVRNPNSDMTPGGSANSRQASGDTRGEGEASRRAASGPVPNPAGAPPLDWWNIPTHPFPGAHYATFPPALCVKPILAMCPQRVCTTCGQPSRRIVGDAEYVPSATYRGGILKRDGNRKTEGVNQWTGTEGAEASVIRQAPTLGWSSCGHDQWRNGLVLDPFGGSGTTAAVSTGHGRDCILIDLDPRNAQLAAERVGMFLEVEEGARPPPAKGGKVVGVEPIDVRSDLL